MPEKNIIGTIKLNYPKAVDQLDAVQKALDNPIGSPTIEQLVKEKTPNKVVIVVNDITRPTPYQYMLPPLIKKLKENGITREQITFVIALGIHRPNSKTENMEIYTKEIAENYSFINHDCDANLTNLGKLSNGMDLLINKQVAEADLLITTGLIGLHSIAGYSGGRKSILPGVVGRELIAANHSLMTDPRAVSGRFEDNPVHHLMMEAARKAGVDFILNVIINENKEIVQAVAGDLEKAWIRGTEICRKTSMVTIHQKADVVVASAGGYPKDLNVYQAVKALENAAQAVNNGGTIILVAQCSEGLGEAVFEQWMSQGQSIKDIIQRFQRKFVLGGHKAFVLARILQQKDVLLISDLSREETEQLFCHYSENFTQALDWVKEKHGENFKAWLMPQAGYVFPLVN